ncbi:hypothetical protein NPIL_335451 [Nephila pilipes]|uniref:Uncharacterized protein n=1 Tax=Nephila pilipes TaxID=299642 RepID=A0A8X6QRS5_NEPPI|nr:hypothetical protein NPIL_335451 [Nephila pilipes]
MVKVVTESDSTGSDEDESAMVDNKSNSPGSDGNELVSADILYNSLRSDADESAMVDNKFDSPGSDGNPTCRIPSYLPYGYYITDEYPNPEALGDDCDPSTASGTIIISRAQVHYLRSYLIEESSDEEPTQTETEMADEQPLHTSTEIEDVEKVHTSSEKDNEEQMKSIQEESYLNLLRYKNPRHVPDQEIVNTICFSQPKFKVLKLRTVFLITAQFIAIPFTF